MPTKQTIAQAKYDAKNCKNYHFKLVIKTDQDIIDKLSSVPSMQGYIKQLIRADIEGSSDKVRVFIDGKQDLPTDEDKVNTLIAVAENCNLQDKLFEELSKKKSSSSVPVCPYPETE